RVPATNWMVLIAVIAAIFALGKVSTGQEYEPYRMNTGIIHAQSELCFSSTLSQPATQLLDTWQRMVNEIEAYDRGVGPAMNEEDAIYAQALFDNNICHTVASTYHVYVTQSTEGYMLVNFDEQYGFETGTFIVNKRDIMLDRGL
ncbi:MAG: hypothetical protein JRE40_10465, partial [Deltaproteobacteria bacterium]|nr:hypothetical protein [Deltaproteobacteria bacterium]